MIKVIRDISAGIGTSRMGEIDLCYLDIIKAIGDPMDGDEYKVSGEWAFKDEDTGDVFTLYDYKLTNLYDRSLPSVKKFRAQKIAQFNIGANSSLESVNKFKAALKNHIGWVKNGGKDVEKHVLGVANPLGYIKVD